MRKSTKNLSVGLFPILSFNFQPIIYCNLLDWKLFICLFVYEDLLFLSELMRWFMRKSKSDSVWCCGNFCFFKRLNLWFDWLVSSIFDLAIFEKNLLGDFWRKADEFWKTYFFPQRKKKMVEGWQKTIKFIKKCSSAAPVDTISSKF